MEIAAVKLLSGIRDKCPTCGQVSMLMPFGKDAELICPACAQLEGPDVIRERVRGFTKKILLNLIEKSTECDDPECGCHTSGEALKESLVRFINETVLDLFEQGSDITGVDTSTLDPNKPMLVKVEPTNKNSRAHLPQTINKFGKD